MSDISTRSPETPSYSVRCRTCDWEWEDEYNEGPLTRERARRMGSNHECEPEVEIHSPVTGRWHDKWALTGDEAKVTARQSAPDPSGGAR